MNERLKILFIFVDGLGLGSADPTVNPLCDARFPNLQKLLARAIPIDACMGVDGLPQSATGQAALFTGKNTSKLMGRHIEGFPPPTLKQVIRDESLFLKLKKIGKHCTFANSYWRDDVEDIPPRLQSVTTVMTLSALGGVRNKEELLSGNAITHDITRWTMHTRGYDGEHVDPETAADHLLQVAEKNDFTLFEHFLTDRAGHSGDLEKAHQCLDILERFLPRAAAFSDHPEHLFLLCSDHGNLEDLSTKTHTKNPVPLIAIGKHAGHFKTLKSLPDITPAILKCYTQESD
jgi:2,3-bisphosphoglycerate-independent phosphoglycerate mutase